MINIFSLNIFWIAILLLGPKPSSERSQPRQLININEQWSYLEENTQAVDQLDKFTNWELINLPHTWNQWDATDYLPGYRRDASWYRKQIQIPKEKKARFILYFEGANITSEVYVNQQLVGKHVGGYVGFEYDITDFVKLGKRNDLSIRVDNSYNPDVIPSQKSDFFIYGGLTRDVWLKIVPAQHIEKVKISTPQVSNESAETQLDFQIANPELKKSKLDILLTLFDPISGKIVAEHQQNLAVSKSSHSLKTELPSVANPKLWSPDHPFLYDCRIQLLKEGQVVDEYTEKIGYRWYDFEAGGAFFLNGERLLLRGTHRHEEHAGYGAAMPNHLHRKDIGMIKEMGANFLRLGHYPQDPEIYRACDSLGVILWDELPWCRGGKGGQQWEQNTLQLLEEQIEQNYNHPSIFFWSLGNEIYWLPDFEGGDATEDLNAFVGKLHVRAHELDSGRLTAIRKYYAGSDLVDVFSPSIWSGWYAGVYKNYEQTIEQQRPKYEKFLHMEYGGSSHIGRHTETPIDGDGLVNPNDWAEAINQVNVTNIAQSGDWTENYIVDLFDWHLSVSETSDWFAGNAQWAFKDFGTPLRPENPIPFMNQKGLVDRAGNPKDAYFVYKSYWAKTPFTYIESHSWTERQGPKGKPRDISVFSNCTKVTLVHNGESLGQKSRDLGVFPAGGLTWPVYFQEGGNELIANGYQNGQLITSDTLVVQYNYEQHGPPEKIVLNSERLTDGKYLIHAFMRDKDGRRVLDYEGRVYFTSDGAGDLLIDYGIPTRSQVVEMANGHASIEWQPEKGKTVFEARNQDFKGSYLVLELDEQLRQR